MDPAPMLFLVLGINNGAFAIRCACSVKRAFLNAHVSTIGSAIISLIIAVKGHDRHALGNVT